LRRRVALSAKLAVTMCEAVVALSACEAVPVNIPKKEPVLLPVKEPESREYKLLEKDPVKGPSPLCANEFVTWNSTEVEIANEAVSA
jgi:hypothetical protein